MFAKKEARLDRSILREANGNWVKLTLNRPDRLNAFNDAMHGELREALEECANSQDCRAVLLTGAGRGFCAGQDLGDRDPRTMDGPPDLSQTLSTFYNPLVRSIRAMPKPVVCAVNGVAAGAGANIALACDVILAAQSAKFIQSFAKVGLVPDAGGSWHLPRLLGEARAKALAFTAEPLDASTAADWGLIWKAVPDEALHEEARALMEQFAQGPTVGFGLTKQAIHASTSNSLDAQLDLEAKLQKTAGQSPDYQEGVTAFLEKRPARFSGKSS